ncbi:MAG: glycoside hydrolase family 43 protein [Puniceicoccaceae bacterium]
MTLLKIRRLTMLTVFVSSSLAFSQTETPDSDAAEDEVILTQPWFGYEWIVPEFEDISVHDPSIVVADGQFYVFGSHLSAAKTEDFMKWDRVADLVSTINPLFDNVFVELAETFQWAQTQTLWAADVIQLEDGKYYFYYNACRGDSPRSAMGVAVADSVEGLYVDQGIILKSGQWGQISEDGETVYDAVVHPNVVDPDTFFDDEGKLWMVYGSYSGGIFILEMDPLTGLPVEGQGYGKHLMGGNHQRIEAPHILYSPHTGYYYLFVTFGGLDAVGGYNVRVARSLTPDGPYFDMEGNDMRDVIGPTAFNDAAIEPYGAKLMGNYLYVPTQNQLGYVSPGHSTSYLNAETGQYFLIFHTRFPYRGEFHQVRVHEMFFNEDGWPVLAPLRYAPRIDLLTLEPEPESSEGMDDPGDSADGSSDPTQGEDEPDPADDGVQPEPEETPIVYYSDPIETSQLPGEYQFIFHGKDITSEIKRSQELFLYADGTLRTGSLEGSWQFYEIEVVPEVPEPVESEQEAPVDPSDPPESGEDGDPGEEVPIDNPVLKNMIRLEIESFGSFKGVVSLQWNEFLEAFTVTISALSEQGTSIWGARWAELPVTSEP